MHQITHLAFADDLMVMARGHLISVQLLENVLQEFGDTSGLRANWLKSSLFLAGVRGPNVQRLRTLLGLPKDRSPSGILVSHY